MHLLINGSLSAPNGCWATYIRASNSLYLLNDAASAFLGPLTPGVAGSLSNSQCTLDGGASSAYGTGNSLVFNAALSFRTSFGGAKTAFLIAVNYNGLNSGWQTRGSWSVSSGQVNLPPTADFLYHPTSGGSVEAFYTQFSDPNGSADIAWTYLLINSSLNGAGGCYVLYNRLGNALFLVTDAGNALLGPLTPAVAGTVQNSQCLLDAGGSYAVPTGNSVIVNAALTFKYAFTGPKNIYLLASDAGNLNSGWQTLGTYYVH